MGILRKQSGSVHELAKSPMGAMLAGMFVGRPFHKGLPRAYSALGSEAFEQLDEANRAHVTAALRHRAKVLKCPVSDLAWAVGPKKMKVQGLYPVMVKTWEEVEREQFEQRKAVNG